MRVFPIPYSIQQHLHVRKVILYLAVLFYIPHTQRDHIDTWSFATVSLHSMMCDYRLIMRAPHPSDLRMLDAYRMPAHSITSRIPTKQSIVNHRRYLLQSG